jgi:hypothetical protein
MSTAEEDAIAERRRVCLYMRIHHKMSVRQVNTWWNERYPNKAVSPATTGRDIKETLEQSVSETRLDTAEWRQLHIERIESVLSGAAFQAKLMSADPKITAVFSKLMGQLITLTGAQQPVPRFLGDEEKDVGQLTAEERVELVNDLLRRARARKAAAEAEANPVEIVRRGPLLLTDSRMDQDQ